MEYFNENAMIERDISPSQLGRQNVPDQFENDSVGGAPACPWASQCADGWGLASHPLSMVYAPCQSFHSLYDVDTALARGTLFSELDLPLEVVEGNYGASGCCLCRKSGAKHLM